MKRFISTSALLIAVMLGGHATAASANYDCQIGKIRPKSNWISKQISFEFMPAGVVLVRDDKIKHFLKKESVSGTVRKVANGKLRIQWQVSGIRTTSGSRQPTRIYTAEIKPETGALRIYAKVAGYPHKVSAAGQCR